MSVTISTITQTGSTRWLYTWSGTTAPYRVYLDGALYRQQDGVSIEVEQSGATAEPPVIEVLDANDTATPAMLTYPQRAVLQWRGTSAAMYYDVEQYSGGTWVLVQQVAETGGTYYAYTTGQLDDLSAEQWRVVAVDRHGNESSALAFSFTVVRHPAAPDISLSYATNDITVSAG